ncbi:DUF5683 domain-containing protein [Dyadobacter sp. CY326]|uniref:DUF5683 domain-containing protein n=1 Tax=Dyadobacter sp. CY326 TaxID=2907300 RepID=UPI001F3048D4|nr:DUF5683 domain-containing protein [Dyadobacter sp. CY326]MCE7066037.1 DUF5683 domain-containing protein [Dyadobacter sp. CY326]
MKNWLWLVAMALCSFEAAAQRVSKDSVGKEGVPIISADSAVISTLDSVNRSGKRKKFMPNPKTATRLALIPGGGQIYNRDYWKLPIVYIAFGGGLYTYYLNSLKYHDYLDTYRSFYDLDPSSKNYGNLIPGYTPDLEKPIRVRNLLNTNSEMTEATRDQAARGKNYWRRNRGFSLIVSGLIYTLSIIEANVAAHLKTFDLSEDLTLRVEPKLNQPAMLTPTPGVRLVFNLK